MILLLLVTPLPALAELPVAEAPRVFINTNYRHPSGATFFVGEGGDLQLALKEAQAGDTIVLEAGAIYSGNFTLPAKNNPGQKWIYIESSAISKLPAPGTRVSPSDAVNMPKIVTPNGVNAFTIASGGGYVRFVGIEMYSTSTYGAVPGHKPWPVNGFSYDLIYGTGATHVTVDRCYLHGSDTQDINRGVGFGPNSSNIAVVDSDIRDIHGGTNDSQAFGAWASPGPFKLVNNYLAATTENVMFGGGGGYANPYVMADIEIRNNLFDKPLKWLPMTLGLTAQWTVKNHLECKSCLRMIVTGNTMQNAWKSADQQGENIVLTPRTNQSGYNSVVDDITIQNNILENANWGFTIAGYDYNCLVAKGCTIVGETKRIVIQNNLILTRDPADQAIYQPMGFVMGHRMEGMLIQHNTVQGVNGSQSWGSIYFSNAVAPDHPTNIWILDNVLSRQPTGDGGYQGQKALETYMPLPRPTAPRFRGNVIFVPPGSQPQGIAEGNVLTSTAPVYKDPAKDNFELLSHVKVRTTDGAPPGVDMSRIELAMASEAVPPARVQPETAILRPKETAQFSSPVNRSSWRLMPTIGSITSTGLYTSPANIKEPACVTVCTSDTESRDVCASIVLLPAR